MARKIELLAPGGDVDAIKAAIIAGANAVYCGLATFNARNRAANLSFEELTGVIRLAHQYQCEVFLTLNVVILEHEMAALIKLLNRLVNTGIDGIIVQDLGVFYLVKHYFPRLNIHASTQLTTHNEGQIKFLSLIGATRVNLSRELNLTEIKQLTAVAHQHQVLTEVFVHGALCIAFSGQCYSSSVSVGNSGNRGRCSQACRDEYEITAAGNRFPLNLKDNSAYFDLPDLVAAQVDSLKIEGRIKGANYVYTVVDSWRQNINRFVESGEVLADNSSLYRVFNRDFTNSFLHGDLTKKMFIDNPRDHSIKHAVDKQQAISVVQIQTVGDNLHAEKIAIQAIMAAKIAPLSIDKFALNLQFNGQLGEPLTLTISKPHASTTDALTLTSAQMLQPGNASQPGLLVETLTKRFGQIDSVDYRVDALSFDNLDTNLMIPYRELSRLKQQLLDWLNQSLTLLSPVVVPRLEKHPKLNAAGKDTATLSFMISDEKDCYLLAETAADIYFKLPESFKKGDKKFIQLLLKYPRLIPWFPAVLIGKDYIEAVNILEQVRPSRIVSNNTGIAYHAFTLNIAWIAGPFLNTTNSYALLTLQQSLNCAGAFISNEINRDQIKNIARPANFKLLYSIYHPILMMTSRQCFFQQTVGCNKPSIEDGCMLKCEKATTITNVKGISFAVDKQKGGYPSIYNHEQFLNFDVVRDFSHLFDEFFIDLTNIGAGSKASQDKSLLIQQFTALVNGDPNAQSQLQQWVPIATNAQYIQGL